MQQISLHHKRSHKRFGIGITLLSLVAGISALFFSGCRNGFEEAPKKEELLIYCGITMVKPVQEIADLFESRTGCVVKIIKGGSGNLYRSIRINASGDLYLPGSDSYIHTAQSEELVTETVIVGYNRAAILVKKGNPLSISPDLNNLIDARYRVVLGSEDSGSIGRETARILRRRNLYDEAMKNSLYLTTDSKDLTNAIKEDKADLVINWFATGVGTKHVAYVHAIRLDEKQAPPHKLVLGLLTSSINTVRAHDFMVLAGSEEGQAVFRKCGFGK